MAQGEEDKAAGSSAAVEVPPASAGKAAVVAVAVRSVKAQMAVDRKTTALKSLQVCSRRTSYRVLVSLLMPDCHLSVASLFLSCLRA